MTTRYWAPTTAHLGPDAVDLAMIEPSGEPRMDLGAALLGMHRVGAAACKVAAATPLLSETTLVKSIAAARQSLADPMINSVSKSTSGATYAALLARDLFDDAEEGALGLFRFAVAKGVPAPVAAERAGAVYGVPAAEMGRYRALAADPRVQPAVLADAADRVLLTYVEKVVGEETRESVSKVTPTRVAERPSYNFAIDPDDPSSSYYDVRDARGRFSRSQGATQRAPLQTQTETGSSVREAERSAPVATTTVETPPPMSPAMAMVRSRLGLGRQTAPEVGTTPQESLDAELQRATEAEQAAQQLREIQQFRSQRRQAQKRRQRQQEKASTGTATQLAQPKLARPMLDIAPSAALLQHALTGPTLTPPVAGARHELLETVPETGYPYEQHGFVYNFALPTSIARSFLQKWGSSPDQMFRMNHLRRIAGGPPQVYDPSDDEEAFESIHLAKETAQQSTGDAVLPMKTLTPDMWAHLGDNPVAFAEWLDTEKGRYAREQGTIARNIQEFPARDGDGWILVDQSKLEPGDEVRSVVELHAINPDSARVGEGRHVEWALDPNQAWRPANIDERPPGRSMFYWSVIQNERGEDIPVLHSIHYLVPVREDEVTRRVRAAAREQRPFGRRFAKAEPVTVAERRELSERARVQPRDEQGQFARNPTVAALRTRLTPVPTAAADTDPNEVFQQHLAERARRRSLRDRRRRPEQTTEQPQLTGEPLAQSKIKLSQEGLKRVLDYKRLSESLPDPGYPGDYDEKDTPPPFNALDLSDGFYRAMPLDEFAQVLKRAGAQFENLEPPKRITIRQKADVERVASNEQILQGADAERDLTEVWMTEAMERSGFKVTTINNWPTTMMMQSLDAARFERDELQRPEVGMIITAPVDPAGLRMKQVKPSAWASPVVLIDFSDERVTGEQPFDLVFRGLTTHYDANMEADHPLIREIEGSSVKVNFPVWRYEAVPVGSNE